MAPQIKITYIEGTGRAELTRLLLAYGGVEFVDVRIKNADLAALKPTFPLGQVPTIEVDGVTYSQGAAMARYAAKLVGLYPEAPLAVLHNDMISETLLEINLAALMTLFREKDEAVKAEKLKTIVTETIPKAFGVLERMVQGKFFGGDNIAHADVHLFDVIQNGLSYVPGFSLEGFPKLQAVVEGVRANANIAAYLAKHQK